MDALQRLLPGLKLNPRYVDRRRAWVRECRRSLAKQATTTLELSRRPASGIPFADVIASLDQTLPRAVTIVSDAGSFNDWFVRYLPFPTGRHYVGPISGSMGFAIPGAIGQQLARPDSRTVVLTGDGGFLMSGMEVATLARLGLPVTVVVFRNDVWGSIALHQDQDTVGERFAIDLPAVSEAAVARGLGAIGLRVDSTSHLKRAFARAFKAPTTVIVEVPTDPARPAPDSYDSGGDVEG